MKRIVIVGLVVALLVAVVPVLAVGPAGVGRGKATAPPDIEKITFVHYVQSAHSSPVWDDTEDDYRLIAGGVKWFATVSYEVNPAGSGLEAADVESTLGASLETWDDQTGFELFDPPEKTTEPYVGGDGDGTNIVVWDTLTPGVIAVCYLWYNPATKEIVESDVVFNDYYGWSLAGETGKMDLQNIATHEFGHNGLNDLRPPKDQELTMYGFSDYKETKKQTLGAGDILGIQAIYGP